MALVKYMSLQIICNPFYCNFIQVNLITASSVRRLNLQIQKSQAKLVGVEGSPQKSSGIVFIPVKIPGMIEPYYEIFYVVGRVKMER